MPHHAVLARGSLVSIAMFLAPWPARGAEPNSTPVGATEPTAPAREPLQELAQRGEDPTSMIGSLTILDRAELWRWGGGATANIITVRPYFPFEIWGLQNAVRVQLPYRSSADLPPELGLMPVELLDVVSFNAPFGHWGVGLVAQAVDPQNTTKDNICFGPAEFIMVRSGRLVAGLLNRSFFADETALSSFQPWLAYYLGGGWSLSLGEVEYIIDWHKAHFTYAPIAVQVSWVFELAGQPLRLLLNPQYNFIDDKGSRRFELIGGMQILIPSVALPETGAE